jgi:hypothetical protein
MMFRPVKSAITCARAHFDVLEVQGELLAGVARGGALHQLVRVFLDRLHLEDELGVGLVRRVFPDAAGLDHHAGVAALLEGVDEPHGRAEIAHVQAPDEVARDVRVEEVHEHLAALLADVDPDVGRGEVHDHAALAGVAAAEIDVAQVVSDGAPGLRLGEHGRGRGCRRRRCPGRGRRLGSIHRHDEELAVQGLRVGEVAGEVEHQARAAGGLHHGNVLEVAFAGLELVLAQGVDGVGEVDRDARQVRDRSLRRPPAAPSARP